MLRNLRKTKPVVWMAMTAMLMAMNVIMSMSVMSIPVPGGHLYINDVVICTAALMLDPLAAFLVGGVGAFLGDFFFYPAPMFVSLVTHGLEAVVVSVCMAKLFGGNKLSSAIVGVFLGAVIMVTGYSLGRAFVYGNPANVWIKMPFEILQAVIGAVSGVLLVCKFHLDQRLARLIRQ